jgi:hypothetical protein
MGRVQTKIAPTIVITNEITLAKIGRSMKKCESNWKPSNSERREDGMRPLVDGTEGGY